MKAIINTGPVSAFDINLKPSPSKEGVWKYGIRCKGIRKKCRKVDWHTENGSNGLAKSRKFDQNLALEYAKNWIERQMKKTEQAFATATFWVIDDNGMERWEPFTDSHNIKIPITI